MATIKQLPPSMMIMLRGRRGLKENDTSQDQEILKMKPYEIVRSCAAWKLGDSMWADIIARWMKEAKCEPKDLTD